MSDAQHPPSAHPGPPPPLPQAPPHPGPTGPALPYTAPYALPRHPQYAAAAAYPARRPGTPALGFVALILAIVAIVAAPVLAAVASFAVGDALGADGASPTATWNWDALIPVRDAVLVGEIAFWAGTVLGVWAIVQGIVAIVTRRGRGAGIAAVIVAAIAPGFFVVAAWLGLFLGAASATTGG